MPNIDFYRPAPHNSARPASGKSLAFFEFWPTWLIYLPVILQWPLLALRYRSLTLPLLANPEIPLGGMVGASKANLMSQTQGACAEAFLPWVACTRSCASAEFQARQVLAQTALKKFDLPFVIKPDIGCRGAGVKRVKTAAELAEVIDYYPENSVFIVQQLAQFKHEAGIFYVRDPGEAQGSLVSMAFKHLPSVTGDGRHSLAELIEKDPRAGALMHLYESRHQKRWHQIVPEGEVVSLLFSASHCRGAVFTDGRMEITPALIQSIDRIMQGLPKFHYGRLDVKFSSLEKLREGKDLELMEINGASAEAIHIWDKNSRLRDGLGTLMWHYRTLFRIGATQRQCGYKTPGLLSLWRAWRHEQKLTRYYPETD